MRSATPAIVLFLAVAATSIAIACGSDDEEAPPAPSTTPEGGARSVEPAGETCAAPTQCYDGVDGGADGGFKGTVTCLTKVTNGYCTHTCTADTDCCAIPGECRTSVKQVCSPFENQTDQYCFLSCEDEDIQRAIAANADAGYYDGGAPEAGTVGDAYCRSFAGASTTCRSSGGGSQNRKVCIPNE
jgi:hypothetical protein